MKLEVHLDRGDASGQSGGKVAGGAMLGARMR